MIKLRSENVALNIKVEHNMVDMSGGGMTRKPSTSKFFEHKAGNFTTKNSFNTLYSVYNGGTPEITTLGNETFQRLATETNENHNSFKQLQMKNTISNYHNASLETVIQKVQNSPLSRARRLY